MALELDHLVFGARDLAEGCDWMEQALGAAPVGGGVHEAMGTHNALWSLGPVYLEVIACNPAAPPPPRPRWYGLDSPAVGGRLADGVTLLTWVMRSTVPEADLAAMPPGTGPFLAVSRGALNWRITVPADGALPGGGLLPTLIAWDADCTPPHLSLPASGLRLAALEVTAPQGLLGWPEPSSGPAARRRAGVAPCLSAEIDCGGGRIAAFRSTEPGLARTRG